MLVRSMFSYCTSKIYLCIAVPTDFFDFRRRRGKYAIGSACIGGGQGIAVLFENIS